MLDIALVAVFSAWAILSLTSQLRPRWMQRLKSNDLLHLIPNWRFFAPSPARRDYHLEYRVRRPGFPPERWRRIVTILPRRLTCAIWHPAKRRRKAFNTLVRRLMRIATQWGPEQAGRSIAYLTLLNHVQHRHASPDGAVQFRIVTAQDFCAERPVRLAFTSDWHAAPLQVRLEVAA